MGIRKWGGAPGPRGYWDRPWSGTCGPNTAPGEEGPSLESGQGALWPKPHIHNHLLTFRLQEIIPSEVLMLKAVIC